MTLLQSLLVAVFAAVCTLSLPPSNSTGDELASLSKRSSSQGYSPDGFFYAWWTDDQSDAAFAQGPSNGSFTVTWHGSNGHITAGKGWNPGYDGRVINYTGVYQPDGSSYLAVYGWTRNPLIEYLIIESYGGSNPASGATRKGSVVCDGASYDIYQTIRYSHIDGTQTLQQYWSVRNPKKNPGGKISGTVSTGCHFAAWRDYGMPLATSDYYYQLVVVDGSFSSGNAQITVSSS